MLVDLDAGLVELIAPDHIFAEVPAVVTMAALGRTPRLTRPDAEAAISRFLAMRIRSVPSRALALDASALVHSHGCVYYDALYVALAQRLGVRLLVADWRLYRLVRPLPGVTWIGTYPS